MTGSASCLPFRHQTALTLLAFHLILIKFLSFSYSVYDQYTISIRSVYDPVLVNLYFYTLRELNTYINFFFVWCCPTDPVFWHFFKKQEKETTRFIFFGLKLILLISKMSIITAFPGIKRSVVYPFCFLAFWAFFL